MSNEQKIKASILIVIIILTVIFGVYSFQKNRTTVPAPQAQAPTQTAPVGSLAPFLGNSIMPEDISTLPSNQLIPLEEAAKIAIAINEKIKAGTLTAEAGKKQMDFLRTHLAPPPISDKVKE